jgi:hypothetical protein
MICFTQLIYLKPGMEATFHRFEEIVLPLLENYGGKLLCRIRPTQESIIASAIGRPYEIHFVSFASIDGFNSYLDDDDRKRHMALKDSSVEKVILIEGDMKGFKWE